MAKQSFYLSACICLCVSGMFTLISPKITLAADTAEPAVRKYDPSNQSFQPVDSDAIIPGKIYNHYSAKHGRYVWAFALEGGGFSYPLGPGSTESPRNFDLVTSVAETQRLIDERVGEWGKYSKNEGRKLLVRLGTNDQWQLLRSNSVRSHFDLDSGRRWQWSGQRKVPIGHLGGYTWVHDGSWYRPATPLLSIVFPTSLILPPTPRCNCW